MQVPGRALERLSGRELATLKQHAQQQITKLQQALDSLNQSIIQHSLKPQYTPGPTIIIGGGTSGKLEVDGGDTAHLVVPFLKERQATTEEKIQEAKQFIGAIGLLLHDAEQQKEAVTIEIQRRSDERLKRVATNQAQLSSELDAQVKKEMDRHLSNAQSNQYDTLAEIQQSNRRHESKVAAIRKQIAQQRSEAVESLLDVERRNKKKEEARQAALQQQQQERQKKNEEKDAKLAEKMAAFDRARMKLLEGAPRGAGDFIKDLTRQTKTPAPVTKTEPTNSVAPRSKSAALAEDDVYSPGVLERLTKQPPRGIPLMKELDTSMHSHLYAAERSKAELAAYVRGRREGRLKVQNKNFDELYQKKEEKWMETKKREKEEEQRMEALKAAQREQLDRLTLQREEYRQRALEKSLVKTSPEVDHWAARARLLIASACRAASINPLQSPSTKQKSMDPHHHLRKGFEQARQRSEQ